MTNLSPMKHTKAQTLDQFYSNLDEDSQKDFKHKQERTNKYKSVKIQRKLARRNKQFIRSLGA